MVEVITKAFEENQVQTLISGEAGKHIKVIAFHICNNSTTTDTRVNLASLSPTIYYYGGEDGSIFLTKDGGDWGLPITSIKTPWFQIAEGKDLVLDPVQTAVVAGTITYYIE